MILCWFALFLCIFGAFGNEHQSIGKHPRTHDYKEVRSSLKIINGNKTSITKYPFISALLHSQQEFGAAVILNKRWMVTTGYTVVNQKLEDIQLRVGSNSYASKGQVLKASQVIMHPNYTGSSWDYDIAVIKTDKPIKFNKKVKPIKLGSQDLKGGTKVYVAGWGSPNSVYTASEDLLEAQVTVCDWDKCAETYKTDLTPQMMCTFDKSAGPCGSDFGDPLVKDDSLYGLYAGGYGCRPGVHPVLYSDIPALATWVKKVITSGEEDSD